MHGREEEKEGGWRGQKRDRETEADGNRGGTDSVCVCGGGGDGYICESRALRIRPIQDKESNSPKRTKTIKQL